MSSEQFVTVTLVDRFQTCEVEMPGATTARYAAKRMAEAAGLDPDDRDWALGETETLRTIPQNAVIAKWAGKRLSLRLAGPGE